MLEINHERAFVAAQTAPETQPRTEPRKSIVSVAVFIKRLRRLLVLRYQAAQYLDSGDLKLLDRSIYATYCDCRELGAVDEAAKLLDEARSGSGPWMLRRGESAKR